MQQMLVIGNSLRIHWYTREDSLCGWMVQGPKVLYFKGPGYFFHLEYVLIEIGCPVEMDKNE